MKIKPCPWCGKIPELWDEEDPYSPGGPVVIGYYIECSDCGLRMSDEDEKKLIRRWNKRK
jgi:Lar family restriction alleviation protein